MIVYNIDGYINYFEMPILEREKHIFEMSKKYNHEVKIYNDKTGGHRYDAGSLQKYLEKHNV